jgi:hypothetical protein
LDRYIQFHPLAYLVKLNIEMTMANLIKRIAISTSKRTGMHSIAQEFKSSNNMSSTDRKTTGHKNTAVRGSVHELASIVSYTGGESKAGATHNDRVRSFTPTGNQIKTTQEVTITSEPNPYFEHGRRTSEVEITGAYLAHQARIRRPDMVLEERSNSEVEVESLKSEGGVGKREGESDDEAALVGRERGRRGGVSR